jgi:hypothetical protein
MLGVEGGRLLDIEIIIEQLPWIMTSAFPVSKAGRLPRSIFRGLLNVHSRYGLSDRRTASRK